MQINVGLITVLKTRREWLSGLRCCNQNENVFPVQTPLGVQPGLGIQPHYEASSDHWVANVKVQ